MGQRRHHLTTTKAHTLPSSPTHSSSSSDFEFTISVSPRKSSAAALCPADELFYKGQLLPLHLSPRISMVRTLLLSSASTSTSDTSTTTSRDSTASTSSTSSSDILHHHLDCDSGRPSSAAADDEFKRLTNNINSYSQPNPKSKSSKYFSLPKFSSVFRPKNTNAPPSSGGGAVKRVSSTAKEVIRKYLKKVKPLYEKLSQKQKISTPAAAPPTMPPLPPLPRSANTVLYPKENIRRNIPNSFSGNLSRLYPMNRGGSRSCISSCPSSMGSSPTHGKSGFGYTFGFGSSQTGRSTYNSDASSMEELQSAIQGAIAHCKNSMNKTMVSNEI